MMIIFLVFFFAIISRTVVSAPRPPAPHLLLFCITLRREDGARRPSSYYGLPCRSPIMNYELFNYFKRFALGGQHGV